jgi:hypothetical protein
LLDKYKIIKDNIRRYQVYEGKTWLERGAWRKNNICSAKEKNQN